MTLAHNNHDDVTVAGFTSCIAYCLLVPSIFLFPLSLLAIISPVYTKFFSLMMVVWRAIETTEFPFFSKSIKHYLTNRQAIVLNSPMDLSSLSLSSHGDFYLYVQPMPI